MHGRKHGGQIFEQRIILITRSVGINNGWKDERIIFYLSFKMLDSRGGHAVRLHIIRSNMNIYMTMRRYRYGHEHIIWS